MQTREQVIEAIKRTAIENARKTLGQEAFETRTGIKQSEWRNIHWIRWTDAVREAGLLPKAFIQKTDTDLVFNKLIQMVCHYNKIPTYGEMRFYKRNIDQDFLSHSTITNHFETIS